MTKTRKPAVGSKGKQRTRKAKPTSPPRRQTRRAAPANGAAGAVVTAATRPSKKAAIVTLLERPDGAALGELTKATGWQAHSVRAALTGLRNEGRELVRDKNAAGVTHYRLAGNA